MLLAVTPAAAIAGRRQFPTTRWTLILASKDEPQARRAALDQLMGDYWKPLYFFVRRRGLSAEAAEDAVQGFIAHLLEGDILQRLDPQRGRLRGYLRTAIKHYLANLYEKEKAKKRGGDAVRLPLDFDVAESALSQTPPGPDEAFERAWAVGIMQRALEQLETEFDSGERSGPFEVVQQFFALGAAPSYRDVARRHDMTLPQLKAFLHRARVRYRQIVDALVTDTVFEATEAQAEVDALLQVLST